MTLSVAALIALLSAVFVSVCDAGNYCGYSSSDWDFDDLKYCAYGCCGYRDRDCCAGNVGLIVGLCVGGGVLIFIVIIVICVCRRRRYGGIIYRSQTPAATMVVQQSTVTTQGGVVSTTGVQPGVTYPPYSQPYYPGSYQAAPQAYGYPAAPQTGAYPPQPMPYAAGPPSYDSLQPTAGGGGVSNPGFDNKN